MRDAVVVMMIAGVVVIMMVIVIPLRDLVLTDPVVVMPEELVHPHVHVRHHLESEDPDQARQGGEHPSRAMSRIPHPSNAPHHAASPVRRGRPGGSTPRVFGLS